MAAEKVPPPGWSSEVLGAVAVVSLLAGVVLGARLFAGAPAAPAAAPGAGPSPRELSDRLVGQGLDFHQRKQLDAAEAFYREAARVDPTSSLAQYDLGVVAMERGDLDTAARYFQEAVRLDRGNQLAARNLAWIAQQRGRGAAPTPAASP